LDEDATIAGQKFVCVSFISPEKSLKQKELFFFEKFIHQWEYSRTMEKFISFLNFISSKYHVDFSQLTDDFKEFVTEEKQMLKSYCVDDDYKTFMDHQEAAITEEFSKKHSFQTNSRGLKVRGCFPTLDEAELRCKLLRANDPTHDVYVGPVGVWMPWDPDAYRTGKVDHLEAQLNELMDNKQKNEASAKEYFDKRVKEAKQKAIEEEMLEFENEVMLEEFIKEELEDVFFTNIAERSIVFQRQR
jgi:hypothetical protein